jgi:hypothetical protein
VSYYLLFASKFNASLINGQICFIGIGSDIDSDGWTNCLEVEPTNQKQKFILLS